EQTEEGQEIGLRPLPVERLIYALAKRLDVEQWDIRGQILSHATHGGRHLRGVAGRADMQRARVDVILKQRQVDEGRIRFGQAVVLGVAGHADNLAIKIFAEEFEPLADGLVIRPETSGHGLVDDHDLRGVLSVLFTEVAAFRQRDAQRLKEPQAYLIDLHQN